MKTIILTTEEIEMIKEDIESTRDYLDQQLLDDKYQGGYLRTEYEEQIKQVKIAETILKKIS
jgi:predicted Holliday junction resolvase-like endonuclease